MNEIETKSLEEGNLVLFNNSGSPSSNFIYFVWYRKDKNFRMLLKTFNTKLNKVKTYLSSIKNTYSDSGLGKWDLKTGQLLFISEE